MLVTDNILLDLHCTKITCGKPLNIYIERDLLTTVSLRIYSRSRHRGIFILTSTHPHRQSDEQGSTVDT